MKVVHLSTFDSGGAGRAAGRLHAGLRRIGCDSSMLVARRSTEDPTVTELYQAPALSKRFARAVSRFRINRRLAAYRGTRPDGVEIFSQDESEYWLDLSWQVPACDVLNLHWVAGMVDYLSLLSKQARRTPIVWTLHDMNVFTGGCHYDVGCGRYRSQCGACPQLGSKHERDLSRRVWSRKRSAFTNVTPEKFHIVADSQWLAGEAARSSLLARFPITAIPYGLDIETFAPRNRCHARSVLGIPADARVIMFAADWIENRRKGLPTLLNALSGMRDLANLRLVSAGNGALEVPSGIPHMHFGFVSNDLFLSALYNAADIFVIPSVQEAFGQTALEAMACGTPVVGSAVGGIQEVVRHGVTGYLVPPMDPAHLRDAMVELLRDPVKRAEMSMNCRRTAVEEYSLELQARRYVELYTSVLGRGSDFAVNT